MTNNNKNLKFNEKIYQFIFQNYKKKSKNLHDLIKTIINTFNVNNTIYV